MTRNICISTYAKGLVVFALVGGANISMGQGNYKALDIEGKGK